MDARKWFMVLCACCAWTSSAYAADPLPSGQFVLPYNENQDWHAITSACPVSGPRGYVQPYEEPLDSHQYHMELNKDLAPPKYHLGEDWNGRCSGERDKGAPLYAVANGTVQSVDNEDEYAKYGTRGQGKQLFVRYAFPYAKGTNGVAFIDSVYMHLDSIEPSVVVGSKVVVGQIVAKLGGTGGWPPHLHWGAVWNKQTPASNAYQLTLKKADALKYRAPSLIVDDRRTERVVTPSATNSWVTFLMGETENAPSSTAYVSRDGVNKTLKQAISAGWMTLPDLMFWDNTNQRWDSYANVDGAFFHNGSYYAFKARQSGVTLRIPIPGNRFQDDRARLDMIRAVETNTAFQSIRTETYSRDPNWDTNYTLHRMTFITSTGDRCIAQITHKTNPLLRYTSMRASSCAAATGSWTAWVWTDWNHLY